MRRPPTKPPTSSDLNSIAIELGNAGDRQGISDTCLAIGEALRALKLPDEYWTFIEIGRAKKKNFAQKLSTSLAQKIADALRPKFREILPDAAGHKHESRSGSAGGLKKLDVNYSSTQIGLGLGVSIKTCNFRDEKTARFTKNIKRLDGELRAEAQDYHKFHPYAVLTALVFLPEEAATDSALKSSLRHAWEVFERRSGRTSTQDEDSLFERIWICVYNSSSSKFGRCRCYDTSIEIPLFGLPEKSIFLSDVVAGIEREFSSRKKRKR